MVLHGPAPWTGLRAVGRGLRGDVRVLVLTGSWPADAADADHDDDVDWLDRADLLSIAVLDGPTQGVGLSIALACDLRVVSERTELSFPEAQRGWVAQGSAVSSLVAVLGRSRALELCVTGRVMGASEARLLGLVNLVVPAAELAAATDDLVTAVLSAPRDALIETKALLDGAAARGRGTQCEAGRDARARLLRSRDELAD